MLHLVPGMFCFSFDLLGRVFDLGFGVISPLLDLTLGTSRCTVHLTFCSACIHDFTPLFGIRLWAGNPDGYDLMFREVTDAVVLRWDYQVKIQNQTNQTTRTGPCPKDHLKYVQKTSLSCQYETALNPNSHHLAVPLMAKHADRIPR